MKEVILMYINISNGAYKKILLPKPYRQKIQDNLYFFTIVLMNTQISHGTLFA